MTGAFAVSMPVSAEETTITADSYTLVIPTSATVSDATGFNTLEVTVKGCSTNIDHVTVTVKSDNSWNLVSGDNKVGYGIYNDENSTETTTEYEFKNFNKITSPDGETWSCGIKLTGYSDSTPTGEYTDTITWSASVSGLQSSDSVDNEDDTTIVNDINAVSDTSVSGLSDDSNVSDTTSTGGATENASGTDADLSDSAGADGTSGSTTATGDDVSGSIDTTDTEGSTDTGAAGSTGIDGTTTD